MRRVMPPSPYSTPRAPSRARRIRNAVQATLILGAGATAICGSIWLWRMGTITRVTEDVAAAAIDRSADLGLRIANVVVTGRAETDPAEILVALDIRQGAPILGYDPNAARLRLEALPWVSRASVARRLPGEVRVEIEEYLPVAIWQHDGRVRMIATDGSVIDRAPPSRFANLPVVVGADAPANTMALIQLLGVEPELARKVAAAVRVGGRRWNLEFVNGINVQLPEHDATSAWRRLAVLAREQKLFDKDIIAIDLRLYPGELVIRKAPGSPLVPQQEGKET
jgi:cell division protein FtsQ